MTPTSQLRVLLVGPSLLLGWTESVSRALASEGCTVRVHYYNRSGLRRGVKSVRRLAFRVAGRELPTVPQPILRWYEAWFAARAGRALLGEAKAFRPDLILVLKGEWLRAETLERLKVSTRVPLVAWWVDHPFMNAELQRPWPYVLACIPIYDYCFLFDRSYESDLRSAGARTVHFLPCAADSDLFRPQTLSNEDQAKYSAAVSLIGVHTASRARTVGPLCAVPGLGVWGPGWQRWLTERKSLQAFRGDALEPAEACKVYNASPVNLNTHHHQSRDGGLNTRAFEIPAAGAFELTDCVPGLEALLEPGRELVVYRSPEEAADLAKYYIGAQDERRRIAEAGHRRVLAEHTYRHRMRTLLNLVA